MGIGRFTNLSTISAHHHEHYLKKIGFVTERFVALQIEAPSWSEGKLSKTMIVNVSFSILLPLVFSLPQEKSNTSLTRCGRIAIVVHPACHVCWHTLQPHQGSCSTLGLALKAKAFMKRDCRSLMVKSYLEGLACKSNYRDVLLQETETKSMFKMKVALCSGLA